MRNLKPVPEKNTGAVLLTVVWIMTVFSVMALALSRTVRTDIMLTRYMLAKSQADALAWAGLLYGMDQIRRDTEDKDSSQFDTMAACGIKLEEGQSPREIFKEIPMTGGYFSVGGPDLYGFEDEERRINLNAVTVRNDSVLVHLLALLGVDEERARTVTASVIDWHDRAEDPVRPSKNRPFETIEELLLIEGITPDIFLSMRDFVTVFPLKATELRINPATASEAVIRAVARSIAASSAMELSDADSLARKIVDYRKGNDGVEGTPDDRRIELNEMPLNAPERSLFLMMNPFVTSVSRCFRMTIHGVETKLSVRSTIEAVIDRNDLSVVSWRQGDIHED